MDYAAQGEHLFGNRIPLLTCKEAEGYMSIVIELRKLARQLEIMNKNLMRLVKHLEERTEDD